MHRTLEQIRSEGLDALRKRLGRAGMIRFLQQFDAGTGDYTEQRRRGTDETTLEMLKKKADQRRRRQSNGL